MIFFSSFQRCLCPRLLFSTIVVIGELWVPTQVLNFLLQYRKSFLEIRSACRADHRSQQSCRSRQMKTNMLGWYHLICSTPLSSKISLYYPPYPHAPTPLNQTYSPSLCTLWGKSLRVEAESECKPLLWCNRTPQQVVWSCIGPEKSFFSFF